MRNKYHVHHGHAKGRGIDWEITYVQWRLIWVRSGHWNERGKKQGQYQIARFGDKGPYAPWNVRIITIGDNIREAKLGKKHTPGARRKMSKAKLGKPSGMLGKKSSLETRSKISRAMRGNKNALGNKSRWYKQKLI